MSNLIVMTLERWMHLDNERYRRCIDQKRLTEITPIIGRNGQYYRRHTKMWWFESNGKAYTGAPYVFLLKFKAHMTVIYSKKELDALGIIANGSNKALAAQCNHEIGESIHAMRMRRFGIDRTRLPFLQWRKKNQ